MKIDSISVFEFNRKLKEPFIISFHKWDYNKNLIIKICTDDNLTGIGEASPFKPITGDSQREALTFIKKVIPSLIGEDPSNIDNIHKILDSTSKKIGLNSQTSKAAIDYACYDLIGKSMSKPIYQLLGSKKPNLVPTTITVSVNTPDKMVKDTKKIVEEYRENGLKRLKLKISGNPKLDFQRALKVSNVFSGELVLDANQGYKNVDDALKTFNNLYDELGDRVILVEEPIKKGRLDELRKITSNSKIPIFADESMATYEDMKNIVLEKAVHGVNIKLPKAGGIFWGLKIQEIAKENNILIMVGPMIDGAIGIAASSHFASGITKVYHEDLDTDYYFETDIVTDETRPQFKYGCRIPSSNPGLGIKIKPIAEKILNGDMEIIQKI